MTAHDYRADKNLGCEQARVVTGRSIDRCTDGCPFPSCILDNKRILKASRDAEIIANITNGKPINDLSKTYGLSKRSIQRIARGSN